MPARAWGGGALTKAGAGTLTLNAANPFSGTFTLGGGALILGNANALQNSSVSLTVGLTAASFGALSSATFGALSGAGAITMPSSFNLIVGNNNTSPAAHTGIIGPTASGSRVTKIGTGTLTLGGVNTFDGGLYINAGTVAGTVVNAFGGTGTGPVYLGDTSGNADAVLQVNTTALTFANPLNIRAGSTGNTLTLRSTVAATTFSGAMTLSHDLTVDADVVSGTIALNSPITTSGSGNLRIEGESGSSVTLGGNNSAFTGNVTVNTGTLKMGNVNALNAANTVAVSSGAAFDINNNNETIAGLNDGTGGGAVLNSGAAVRTLTLGGSGTYAFSGVLSATTPANLALTVALTGTGKQTLSGASTYTGATALNDGTLVVSGSLASTVTVAGGAVLSPGAEGNAATAAMTLTGSAGLSLGNGSLTKFEFDTGVNDTIELTSGTLTIAAGAKVYIHDEAGANWTQSGGPYFLIKHNGNYSGGNPNSLLSVEGGEPSLTYTFADNGTWIVLNISGAEKVWDGGSGTAWETGANWGGTAPNAFAALNFRGSSSRANQNNTAGFEVGSIGFHPDATGPFTLTGSWINLNGNVVNNTTVATTHTLDLPVVLAGGSREFNTAAGDLVVSGVIGDGGNTLGITKTGAGRTLTLSGGNTYAGATTITEGTLQIGDGGASGQLGTGDTVNNGALVFNRGSVALTYDYDGDITGTGSLAQNGAGTVTLTGDNAFSGGTTLGSGAGTLVVGNASAIGNVARALALNGGTLDLAIDPGLLPAHTTTVGGTATIVANREFTGGTITHTLGTLGIDGQTLNVMKGANVTSGTAGLTFSGLTTLSVGTSIFNVGTDANLTLGQVTGAFPISKQGLGQLTMNTTSLRTTAAGSTALSAGTLRLGIIGALNTLATAPLSITGGTLLLAPITDVNSTFTGAAVTIGGDATINPGRNASGAGLTHTLGTLSIGGQTLTVSVGANTTADTAYGLTFGATTLTGTPTFNVANNGTGVGTLTLNDIPAGANGIVKAGAGTLALNNNLSTGGVVLNAGTVRILAADSLGPAAAATLAFGAASNARLWITGTLDPVLVGISGDSTAVIENDSTGTNPTITINNTTPQSFAGTIRNGAAGTLALIKNGVGTLTLSGNNDFTGGTTLLDNGGTIVMASTGALGDAGSSVELRNNCSLDFATDTRVNALNIGLGGTPVTLIANVGTLGNPGITHELGALSYVSASSPLNVTAGSNVSGGAPAISFASVNLSITLVFDVTAPAALILGTTTQTSGTAKTFSFQGSGNTTITGDISNGAGALSLSITGTGALTLSGANNTYSGSTTIAAGSTLNINSTTALGDGTGTFFISGGTIDNTSAGAITLANSNPQQWNGDFAFTGTRDLNLGTGNVTLSASRIVTVNGGTLTVGGTVTDGASTFSLTKAGVGTLVLSALTGNTYDGGTTISGGTLRVLNTSNSGTGTGTITVGNSGKLNGTGFVDGAVTVQNGGTIEVGVTGVGMGTLKTGALTLASGSRLNLEFEADGSPHDEIDASGGALTINGGLTGDQIYLYVDDSATAFTVPGTYNLIKHNGIVNGDPSTLLVANAPSGVTYTFDSFGGYLRVTVSSSKTWDANTGSAGAQDGDGTWDTTLTQWLTGSGNAAWVNAPPDAATIGAGGTAGTITLGTGITASGLAFDTVTGNYLVTGDPLTLAAGSVVTVDDDEARIASVLAGTTFTKDGAGALTLSGDNTFTGPLTLNAGTLNLNHVRALGLGAGAGTLTINGVSALGNTSGGAITLTPNNPQAWDADFSFTGPNDLNLGSGAVALGASRQVTVTAGNLTVDGVVSGVGFGLTKAGAATLTLTGANSFNGGLTIREGTVTALTSASALGGSGTGTVTLGHTSGSAAATLLVGTTGLTYANPIMLAANPTVGTLTIGNTGTAVSTTFSGGVTGNNNVTIHANATSGTLTFETVSLNNAGTITHTGAGTGTTTISAVIGPLVTGVTQNSATAALILGGASTTYAGGFALNAGSIVATAAGALGSASSTVTFGGGSLELRAAITTYTALLNMTSSGGTITINPAASGPGVTHTTGSLTIGTRQLSLVPGALTTADTPYGLTILAAGSTFLTGNPTFDVANNGSGVGTLTLAKLDDGGTARTITKQGAGAVTLSTAATSLAAGSAVAVTAGTLNQGAASGLGVNNPTLSITPTTGAGTVAYNITAGGQTLGAITLGGASGTTANIAATVALTLGGNVTYDATSNPNMSTISGLLNVGSTQKTFTIGDSTAAPDDVTVSATLPAAAGGSILKTGPGALLLSGASTLYTGGFALNQGKIVATAAGALGPIASTVTFGGGELELRAAGTIYTAVLNMTSSGGTVTINPAVSGPGVTHTTGSLTIGTRQFSLVPGALTTADTAYGLTILAAGSTFLTGNPTFDVANNGSGVGTLTLAKLDDSGTARTITKQGAGAVTLSTAATSLAAGSAVAITAGTLNQGAASGLGVNSPTLSITPTTGAGTVAYNITAGGQTLGAITLGGASGTTANIAATVALTLGGNVTYDATSNPNMSTISGLLNVGSTQKTFTIGDSMAAPDDVTVSATLPAAAGGSILKTGPGALLLSGASTLYTGGFALNQGKIVATAAGALGSIASTVTFGGGELELRAAGTIYTAVLNMTSSGGTITINPAVSGPGVTHTTGSLTIGTRQLSLVPGALTTADSAYGLTIVATGSTLLTGDPTFDVANNGSGVGTLTLAKLDDGGTPRTITKQGAGTVTLSTIATSLAAGTAFTVNNGILIPNVAGSLSIVPTTPNNTTVTVNAPGELRGTIAGSFKSTGTGTPSQAIVLSGGTVRLFSAALADFGGNLTYNSGTVILDRTTSGVGVNHTMGTLSLGAVTLAPATANFTTAPTLIFGATTLTGSPTFDTSNANITLGALDDGGTARTITKQGANTLALSAGATSLASGTAVAITAGTLSQSGVSALGANNPALSITPITGTGTYTLTGAISQGLGSLTLGGAGSATPSVTFSAAGTLNLNGNLTYDATSNPNAATISGATGTLALGAVQRTLDIGDTSAAGDDVTISSLVTSTGGFIKTGPGVLVLTAANVGVTTVGIALNQGTLVGTVAGAFGNNTSTVTFGGGSLELRAAATTYSALLNLGSSGGTITGNPAAAGAGVADIIGTLSIGTRTLSFVPGTLATSGTQQLTVGTTTLTGNPTFDVSNSGSAAGVLVLGGLADGGTARAINKSGTGTLTLGTLAGSMTSGTTINVNGGTLNVTLATALANNPTVAVTPTTGTGTLLITGAILPAVGGLTLGGAAGTTAGVSFSTTGTLTLNGNLTYDATSNPNGATISGATGTLALGSAQRTFTIGDSSAADDDLTISSLITGTAGFVKAGDGRLTLTEANAGLTGSTVIINAGTLRVTNGSGSALGGDAVTVASGGKLNGTGIVTGSVTVQDGGTIEVGVSGAGMGTLKTGALTLDGNSRLNLEFAADGSSNDNIDASAGELTIDSGDQIYLYVDNTSTAFTKGGTYNLIKHNGTVLGHLPSTLTVANAPGGVTYTFDSYDDAGTWWLRVTIAAGKTWDSDTGTTGAQDGDGTWDTTLTQWLTGSGNAAWVNAPPDAATIGAGGTAGTLTLGTAISASGLTFETVTGNYLVTGDTLTLSAGSVVTVNDDASEIASIVAGSTVTKAGAGQLTLSGPNTFAGPLTISAGTLQVGAGGAAGTLGNGDTVNNSALVFDRSDAAYTYGGAISGSGTVAKNGSGTVTLGGNNSAYSGAITINVGAIQIEQVNALGTTGTGTLVQNGGALWLNTSLGAIAAEPLTLNGLGVGGSGGALRNVTGVNTYSGAITLGSSARINADAGTLTLSGGVNGASGTPDLTIGGGGGVTISTGTIGSNVGTLTYDGGGTLTINVASSHTGSTLVNSGVLSIGAGGGNLPATPVVIDGGTLNVGLADIVGAVTLKSGSITGTTLVLGASSFEVWSGTITAPLGPAGATLTKNTDGSGTGGTVILQPGGVGTYAGAVLINAGTLNIRNANALGVVAGGVTVAGDGAALEIQGTTTTLAEALTLNGTGISNAGALRNILDNNIYAGPITLGSSSRINADSGTTLTLSAGVVTAAGKDLTIGGQGNVTAQSVAISGAGGNLIKDGSGTLLLLLANTYGGNTALQNGTIQVGINAALPATTVLTIGTAGTTGKLVLGTAASLFTQTVAGLQDLNTGSSVVGAFTSPSTLTVNNTVDFTFNGTLGGASGNEAQLALTKNGAGTLTLGGDNKYAGATVITTTTGGKLRITHNNALGTTAGNTSIGTATTLELDGSGGDLTIAEPIAMVASTLNSLAGDNEITGALTITGNVVANITAESGSLTLASGTPIARTTGTITFGGDGNIIVNDSCGGTGAYIKNGNGTLTLNVPSASNGAITINGGTVVLGDNEIFGTGALFVSNGATLDLGGFTESLDGATTGVTLTDGSIIHGTLNNDDRNWVLKNGLVSANIGGTGGLTQSTTGTVILSGNNSGFSGLVTVDDAAGNGILNIRHNNGLGTGNVVVDIGSTLEFQGGIDVPSRTSFALTGRLRSVSGNNTYRGTIAPAAGNTIECLADTLVLDTDSGDAITGAAIPLTFTGAGNITVNDAVSGTTAPGTLTKTGSGILRLNANRSGAGPTAVNEGTILVNATLTTSGAVNVNGGATHGTLGGYGTIPTAVSLNAADTTLSPGDPTVNQGNGNGVSTLTINNTLTLASGSKCNFQLVDEAIGDKVAATTVADLTNVKFYLYETDGDPFTTSGTYTLMTWDGASADPNESGCTVENIGSVQYTFNVDNDLNKLTVTLSTGAEWDGDLGNGGTDSKWKTAANWVGDARPPLTGGAQIIFDTSHKATTSENDYDNWVTFAGITFDATAGGFTLSGNPITLSGEVVNNSANPQSVNLTGIRLYGGSRTFNAASGNITVGGAIEDDTATLGIFKTGSGTLTLQGANAYDGATAINAGALNAQHNTALGNVPGGAVTVADLAALQLEKSAGLTIGAKALNLTGTGSGSGALHNIAGANEYGGAITLNGATTIGVDNGSSLTLNSATAMSGAFTLTIGGAGDTTISSVIGVSALTKQDGGTLTLNGSTDNTYAGATLISGGIVNIQDNGALGTVAGSTTVSGSGAALEVQGSFTTLAEPLFLNGTGVGGDGALRGRGASATPQYTGNITLQSDSLITADNTTTLTLNPTTSITGSGTPSLTLGGAGSIVVSKPIATPIANVTKEGGGTVTINSACTYTGTLLVNAGTVTIGTGANLPANPVVIDAGGTLNVGLADIVGAVTLKNGSITGTTPILSASSFEVWSGTITAPLGPAGATLTKNTDGSPTGGTVILQPGGAGTYAGAVLINAGVLDIRNANALGTLGGGTTVANGAALAIQGNFTTLAEPLNLNGTGLSSDGALHCTGSTPTYLGAITMQSSSLIYADTGTTLTLSGGVITASGKDLTVGGPGNVNVTTAKITGTGGVFKDGAGTLTMSFTHATGGYSGTTALQGGSIQIAAADGLPPTTVLTISGATGKLILGNGTSNYAQTLAGLETTQAGASVVGGNAATASILTVNNAGAYAFDGTLGGSGTDGKLSLVKNGAGTLTLGGSSTLTAVTLTAGALNGAGTLTVTGGYIANNTGEASASVLLAGVGGLTKSGAGTATLSGDNTYSGTLAVQNGAVSVAHLADDRNGSGTISLGLTTADGELIYTGSGATLSRGIALAGSTGDGKITNNGSGALVFTANPFNTAITGAKLIILGGSGSYGGTVQGVIQTSGATSIGVTVTGGTWVLGQSANTYAGITTISGGILSASTLANGGTASSIGQAPAAAANLVLGGGTLRYTGGDVTIDRLLTLSASTSSTLEVTEPTTELTLSAALAATLPASATLVKSGDGTLVLGGTAANTAAATLNVNAGELHLNKTAGIDAWRGPLVIGDGTGGANADVVRVLTGDQLFNTGAVTVNSSGLLVLNGSETIGSLTGASGASVNLGTGTLTVGDANDTTFAGVIFGTGGLVKQGGGTLTLAGANTFTGNTTVDAGVLKLDVGGSVVRTVRVNAGGTLEVAHGSAIADSGQVSLSGATAYVQLDADVTETVRTLVIDGVVQAVGTYGVGQLNPGNRFTGSGVLIVTASAGQVWRVKPSASGAGDGTTWDDACTLSYALNNNAEGDQVWVAQGAYTPASAADYFIVGGNVSLYGGFFGNETALAQRVDPTAYPSIISGDWDHDDVAWNDTTGWNDLDNCDRLVELAGPGALIDGFRLTAVDGDDMIVDKGAISIKASDTTVRRCWVTQNRGDHGAGFTCNGAYTGVLLENCIFNSNAAYNNGNPAGYVRDATMTVRNCTFTRNRTVSYDAWEVAWMARDATLTIQNSILWDWGGTADPAEQNKGGLRNWQNASSITMDYVSYMNSGQSDWTGTGLLTSNPNFVDANSNFRLQEGSPCRDSANNATAPALDIRGAMRPQNVTADRGAYEMSPAYAVTVATAPASLVVALNGNSQTAPHTWLNLEGMVSLAANSPQIFGTTRYVFTAWDDDDGPDRYTDNPYAFAISANRNWTAEFTTQYKHTAATTAGGGTATVNGGDEAWVNEGGAISFEAVAETGYDFVRWVINGQAHGDATVNIDPAGEAYEGTAEFVPKADFCSVQVVTVPGGRSFTVNGAAFTPNPQAISYGTLLDFLTTTPQDDASTQYRFSKWNDGLFDQPTAAWNDWEVPGVENVTLTLYFDTYHKLTLTPGAGGTIAPAPDAGDDYYLNNDVVALTAEPEPGYAFESWGGDLSGAENPKNVTMGAPKTVSATFKRVYFVKQGVGGSSGSGWADAYSSLATALTAAPAGSEFWVAAGTYTPANGTTPMVVQSADAIYGGFAGTESARGQRDWAANPTIISGNLDGLDNDSEMTTAPLVRAPSSGSATVDGFTVELGNNNNISKTLVGGAFGLDSNANQGGLTVRHCIIRNNTAAEGAVFVNNYGSSTFENCLIHDNTTSTQYGNLTNRRGTTTIVNCTFANNTCVNAGVDVYSVDDGGSNPNVVMRNSILRSGTQAVNILDSGSTINNCNVAGLASVVNYTGANNIDADPLFVSVAGGNYRLQGASLCIDKATDPGASDGSDLDHTSGAWRPQDGDGAGSSGTEYDMGAYECELDVTPPTVTINQAAGQADPTGGSPIHFTVVFSEWVSDFATGDVTLGGTAPGTLVGTVTGGGTTYNVAVSGITGSGTVMASIAAGKAHDAAGNPSDASTSSDNTVTYDASAPTVFIFE